MIILCDHCEADYTTCTCLAGEPNVMPAPLPPTSPLDSWAYVDTSVEDDTHPTCPVRGADLDDDDQVWNCEWDANHEEYVHNWDNEE